jgi:hypothetical protein
MQFNTAYIISYLPDDSLRDKRLEIQNKQLDYWLDKGLDVVVYGQNYKGNEIREGVDYIINNGTPDRPGPARNVLLSVFYQTQDDFCLVMDNDITLYEGQKYCASDDLVSILKETPIENFQGVDAFEPLNPTQTPFSAFFADNRRELSENLYFKRRPNISGQSLFMRNTKKFYDKEYYYDDWYDEKTGKIIMGEDVDFGIQLTKDGRGVYSLMNAVRKDMGWTVSSWCKNPEARKQSFETLKKILPTLGIESKNGRQDWAGFANKYNIPRKILASKKKVVNPLEFML